VQAMFRHRNVALAILAVAAVLLIRGESLGKVIFAGLFAYVFFSIGFTMLGSMARPIPEPLPPGELRKLRSTYRCDICGTEVRMTMAPDEDPEPPRHCQDDMRLVATIDDAL